MGITWVVAADNTLAKIYALGQIHGQLVLVKELDNPEGRLQAGNVGYDKPGQFDNPMHGQSETFERADPKSVQLHQFAHALSKILESGRVNHAYERLIIVASPRLHGMITEDLTVHVKPLVHKNIQKDYMHLTEAELYTHVI